MKDAPWAIEVEGFSVPQSIDDQSAATECITTFRIERLARDAHGDEAFRLSVAKTEFVDAAGKPVKAGFGGFGEAAPLLFISIIGVVGLCELRRRRLVARER